MVIPDDESDNDVQPKQCFETIATDVIRKDGHFGLFETVFGLKRSRNAVCAESSKLLQLDKEDLCRIVEHDDMFQKLLKKIIRENIFKFEGETGPWTRKEIEYVSDEVNALQRNDFASKKVRTLNRVVGPRSNSYTRSNTGTHQEIVQFESSKHNFVW